MPLFRTGLKPSPEPPKLRFGAYFGASAVPVPPGPFGHYGLIPDHQWGMMGNDRWGCCAWAGAAHIEMLWNAIRKGNSRFTEADVLDDYGACTGFNPRIPSTDQGTDIVQAATYWQATGVRDSIDSRHRIAAYLAIDPTNIDHLKAASFMFDGGVGLGVQLNKDAELRFVHNQPWDATEPDPEAFHYVPFVGMDPSYGKVVTWGAVQNVTPAWLESAVKEACAYISEEALVNGKTLEGFDMDQLKSDLGLLQE